MALARSEGIGQRFYSMSAQILKERNDYYEALEATQTSDLNVTRWQQWVLSCLQRAIGVGRDTLDAVLIKARFWERWS